MVRILLKPLASTDDASQNGDYGYNYSTNASYALIRSQTGMTSIQRDSGIRFPGTLAPAGTISIPEIYIQGFTHSGYDDPNCDIYVQDSLSPTTFPASAGPNDILETNRPTIGGVSIPWIANNIGNGPWKSPSLVDLARALMIKAGATFTNPTDLIAATPTTVAIENPTFIFRGRHDYNSQFRISSYDSYAASPNEQTAYKIPTLFAQIVADDEPITPSDKRLHIAILSDSIGWAFQPGSTVSNVLVSGVLFGQPYSSGFMRLDNTPAAMVATYVGGQAYLIDDPWGSGIRPEGRKGFTTRGILKDRLIDTFHVQSDEIVIHPYGLGGTTVTRITKSTGAWSNASDINETERLLSTVNVNGNLNDLTNSLWNYHDDTGRTLIDLISDTSIERLMIVYIGGGNDFFNWQNTGGLNLPINRTPANQTSWDTNKGALQSGYEEIGRFCHQLRQAKGGSKIEFVICGYPNFATDDPLVGPIKVHIGAPTSNSYHGTISLSTTTPDAWYGGPGDTEGYMSPYGGPHPIPQVPFLLNYLTNYGLTTNIAGITIPPGPRPMNKDDLGFFWQLKGGNYTISTWSYDSDTDFRSWFSHWAADHYGDKGIGATDADKWNLVRGTTNDPNSLWDGAPPASAFLPANFAIRVPYGARNINNETINGGMHEIIQGAAEAAITQLQAESITCQYVNLWDCLTGVYIGSDPKDADAGSGTTASAGRWAFIDGVHLTYPASQIYADSFIGQARNNSSMLQNLTQWGPEWHSKFMPFFNGPL